MTILSQKEVLAARVQQFLEGSESRVIPTILDLSGDWEVGRDELIIPALGTLELRALPVDGNDAVDVTQSVVGDTLEIKTAREVHNYVYWTDQRHSMIDRISAFFDTAPRIFAQGLEKAVIDQLEVSATNDFDAAVAAGEFNIGNIAEAAKRLDVMRVPRGERFLLCSPDGMSQLASFKEFQEAHRFGGTNDALMNGIVGMIKGFNVVMSPDITDDVLHCYHRNSVAFALAGGSIEDVVQPIPQQSRTYMALKGLYGAKLLTNATKGPMKVTIDYTSGP